jgi:hypothetical protein
VIKILASHQGLKAAEASTEDAGNLHSELDISIGCRLMLVEDLWTERGLVNGAFGTVQDIVWSSGVTWNLHLPFIFISITLMVQRIALLVTRKSSLFSDQSAGFLATI